MGLTRKDVLKLIGAGGAAAAAGRVGLAGALPEPTTAVAAESVSASNIITRDVAIIGGGATGTYSAIRLRDLGKSVVVVETNDRLGGHTHTYTDPGTGAKLDIGVVVWHELPIVRDFFARMDVPLIKASFDMSGRDSLFVDYRTGKVVPGYAPGDPSAALGAYAAQLAQYPYLENGFELPNPVPPDLLLPFGDFVKKYALDAAVNTIFNFGQGLGDLLKQPTLYVMKNFGLDILRNLSIGFLTTERHNNSELYEKAKAELGADALLRSRVVATDRDAAGYANILVQTPGGLKIIRAKKILLTAPPKLDNLFGFDLDATEASLFGQFNNSAYYTGLLRNSGIPDNVSVTNIGDGTPYNLPSLPGVYSISPSGVPGLHSVKYGSPKQLSETQVKADILAAVKRLRTAGTVQTTTPEFAVFASHSPFELTVSPAAIKNGFYRKLYALQGRNRTYYTGAAFHTHDTSLLWQFTEALLPRIAA
ncbi:NAD(P)-binding protein [Micromonosporaceae bacterium Da 78-11]